MTTIYKLASLTQGKGWRADNNQRGQARIIKSWYRQTVASCKNLIVTYVCTATSNHGHAAGAGLHCQC